MRDARARTDAYRRTNAPTGNGDTRGLESSPHTLSNACSLIAIRGQNRGKLLAAESCHDVTCTQVRTRHLRENTQNLIANGMAEPIIDRLEMIKIKHQ